MGALRAEVRQGFAELGLRLTKQIMELDDRIERLGGQRGLIRTPQIGQKVIRRRLFRRLTCAARDAVHVHQVQAFGRRRAQQPFLGNSLASATNVAFSGAADYFIVLSATGISVKGRARATAQHTRDFSQRAAVGQ